MKFVEWKVAVEFDGWCIFRGRQLITVSRYPVVSPARGRKSVLKNCGDNKKVVSRSTMTKADSTQQSQGLTQMFIQL